MDRNLYPHPKIRHFLELCDLLVSLRDTLDEGDKGDTASQINSLLPILDRYCDNALDEIEAYRDEIKDRITNPDINKF